MFDKVKIGQVLSGEVNAVSVDNYLDNLKKAQALAVDVKEITELRKQLLDYVGLINTVLDVVREVSSASLNASDIEGTKSLIERLREEFPEQIVTAFLRVDIVEDAAAEDDEADEPELPEELTKACEDLREVSEKGHGGIPVVTLDMSKFGGNERDALRAAVTTLLKNSGVAPFHAGGFVRGPGTRRFM